MKVYESFPHGMATTHADMIMRVTSGCSVDALSQLATTRHDSAIARGDRIAFTGFERQLTDNQWEVLVLAWFPAKSPESVTRSR